MEPKIYNGDVAVDDRGSVSFVNEFDFYGVKRFYVVQNHKRGFIRAWHGHKNEGKYVYAIEGTIALGVVKVDDWSNPSKDCDLSKYILSSTKPRVLWIPPGYANGFCTLTESAKVIFYSTSTLEESSGDDYRFPHDHWDIWDVEQR